MKTKRSRIQVLLGQFLLYSLILNSLVLVTASVSPVQAQVQAQKRVIIVNADQPNVWTLEQAHYLLAQMHRRNLDLKAKKLEELDPNTINGLRFDLLKMLVEAGASYNEASGVTNKLLRQNKELNAERRSQLNSERDKLRQESLQLTRDISDLETQKAKAVGQDEKDRLAAGIDAKTSLRAKVDKEIELDDNELKTLGDGSGEFKSTEPQVQFDKSKLPESVFDEAFKATTKSLIERFNQSPSLNASLMLDNFLQMQYEIISKQLTLLRDDVGPGERLLFLELPQTVNVTHHEADKKWAQSWWKIAGYTWRSQQAVEAGRSGQTGVADASSQPTPTPATETPRQAQNQKPITTLQDYNSVFGNKSIVVEGVQGRDGEKIRRSYVTKFEDLDLAVSSIPELSAYLRRNNAQLSNQLVRTVELIPRQSSLNVNDMKLRTKAGAFSVVASFLFGFGARLNVQRQREQFSQFVQQELYSSAFGKGSREFGWTFTPMPGTERLLPGVRTTYAAVIVPDTATSLVLESNGCYFPRSSYQPINFADTTQPDWNVGDRTSRNCGTRKVFLVKIPSANPGGSNDFFVSGLTYSPVNKGERTVVTIYGENFSSQTGVLVNGMALTPAIGLAQPLVRDDSLTGERAAQDIKDEKIRGSIERVDANQIVATFRMPPDFVGTPTITLIAPGKALDLNRLDDLYINGEKPRSLSPTKTTGVTVADWMFGKKPKKEDFRIDKVEVFRGRSHGNLTAVVTGAGFQDDNGNSALSQVMVNGSFPTRYRVDSPTLFRTEFPVPSDETIRITVISVNADPKKTETIDSEAISNPARLRITNVIVISYEAATDEEPATLVVKIEGSGFSDELRSSVGELAVKSATEAILKITDPEAAVVVILTDRQTGQQVKTIVTRKSEPPK